jgi:hypothetical protein
MAPSSGWAMNSELRSIPILRAYSGSKPLSTSISAAIPPRRWAAATACNSNVDTPEDSGPRTSTMRPRGRPPTPTIRSSSANPSGMTWTPKVVVAPSRWIEPCPNFLLDPSDRCGHMTVTFGWIQASRIPAPPRGIHLRTKVLGSGPCAGISAELLEPATGVSQTPDLLIAPGSNKRAQQSNVHRSLSWSSPQSGAMRSGRQRRNVAGCRSQRPPSPVVMNS